MLQRRVNIWATVVRTGIRTIVNLETGTATIATTGNIVEETETATTETGTSTGETEIGVTDARLPVAIRPSIAGGGPIVVRLLEEGPHQGGNTNPRHQPTLAVGPDQIKKWKARKEWLSSSFLKFAKFHCLEDQ